MAFQVIHPDEGNAARKGHGLGRGEAHQQGPDQAGAPRRGDPLDIVQGDGGIVERLKDDRDHGLDMLAGCDLRHDASVPAVDPDL